jgi:GAF domain-containing protein
MQGEISRYLQDPRVLIAAAAVALLLLGLIAWLVISLLRRKSRDEKRVRAEMVLLERERQLAAVTEQSSYSNSSEEAAHQIDSLFRDYIWMPVLAIYAGREQDESYSNIFQPGEYRGGDQLVSAQALMLPATVPSSLVGQFNRPQVTRLATLIGGGHLDTGPLSEDRTEGQTTGHPPLSETGTAAVLPWQGAFGWRGLIIARAQGPISPEEFDKHREPLARMSDRLAVALELEAEREQSSRLNERLVHAVNFARPLVSGLDSVAALAPIAQAVATLLGADSAALWRLEPGANILRVVGAHGLSSAEFLPLPPGQGLAGGVAESGQPLALEDAPSDPRCLFPREARESGIGSYLGAPVVADGKVLGVVEVHTAKPHAWSESDTQLLQAAGQVLGELLKSTDIRGNRLKVESAYLGLSEALQRLHTTDELMEAAVEVLGHALGASRVIAVNFEDAGVTVTHEYRAPDVQSATGASFTPDAARSIQQAIAGGEPVAITESQPESLMGKEVAGGLGVQSEMLVPIRRDGQAVGALYLHQCDRLREWQPDELQFADRVGRQLSLSLSNLAILNQAAGESGASREEVARLSGESQKAAARIKELEQRLNEAQSAEGKLRSTFDSLRTAEAEAKSSAESSRRAEAELRQEYNRLREDEAGVRKSAQQLLEINRLKSEFIVNAGRELESSLQSVLGLAELLGGGAYGQLTADQSKAVQNIYTWAKRMKSDVEWLVEYGSSRSRRLESAAEE